MTSRKAWAIPVLIATVALTATACAKATGTGAGTGTGTSTQAGSAYGTQTASPMATGMSSSAGAMQTATATLTVERTRAGTVLAGSKGLTLYYFAKDKPHSGKSACFGSCLKAWPALAGPVKAPTGARMPGPMGTIRRGNGTVQVTINGYPIYYYVGDKAPGQIAGNGVEGTWHIIKIKLKKGSTASTANQATTAPKVTTTPTATPTTNTGGGGGYGY
jgi:predicted lipoprotein with Yx(FWY)xxD motif